MSLTHKTNCRACGGPLEKVFSLEPSPIGDAFVLWDKVFKEQPRYPLDWSLCSCGLVQLVDVISPDDLYKDYLYVTKSSGLEEHFRCYADWVAQRLNLRRESLVIDIGSNDGIFLGYFKALGMQVLGIEPAKKIAEKANSSGIYTKCVFFNEETAKIIKSEFGQAKLITANNVFANVDDLNGWVRAVKTLLSPTGVYVFESFYLANLIENGVFDFLYHEHLSAFSVKPVKELFLKHGMELVSVEQVETKGGSLRYFIQFPGGPLKADGSVERFMESEKYLYEKKTFTDFASKVDALRTTTHDFLENAKKEGKKITAYGASISGTTLMYHFRIENLVSYMIDDNLVKQRRFSPGKHLPVFPTSIIYEEEHRPDYILILAWRFAKQIMDKHPGFDFILPAPEFKIISGNRVLGKTETPV